jgi:hypothetical protein
LDDAADESYEAEAGALESPVAAEASGVNSQPESSVDEDSDINKNLPISEATITHDVSMGEGGIPQNTEGEEYN